MSKQWLCNICFEEKWSYDVADLVIDAKPGSYKLEDILIDVLPASFFFFDVSRKEFNLLHLIEWYHASILYAFLISPATFSSFRRMELSSAKSAWTQFQHFSSINKRSGKATKSHR